jgi:GAF domain
MALNFNNLSIKSKILSIVVLNILFLTLISIFIFKGLITLSEKRNEIVLNGKVLYHFQNADMMHDAIRADVYKLMYVSKYENDEVENTVTEFNEHSKKIQAEFTYIEKIEGLNSDILEQVSNLKPALLNYLSFAEELIKIGQKNDSTSTKALEKKFSTFNPIFDVLSTQNEALSELILKTSDTIKESTKAKNLEVRQTLIFIILISIILSVALSLAIAFRIQKSVLNARDNLNVLSEGNLPPENRNTTKDEIGQMVSSMNSLTTNLKNVKAFADEVGTGNFNSEISVFNNEGALGIALDGMRKSLSKVADEDNKRNWATNGIAVIGEILRSDHKQLATLYNQVINFSVTYLKANQGGLFLLNEENEYDKYLELVSCYAYDKKKYVEKRVDINEGLLGQCYQENDIIYMTDVPDKYTTITSGLGMATPSCIILSPLKVNDDINGVLEIASFTPFEPHQIEFIKRLSENIASVITSVRINERTSRLLAQTQLQSEEMRAQEEEMRQNLEELQATQEEFYRKEQDYINEIQKLKKA